MKLLKYVLLVFLALLVVPQNNLSYFAKEVRVSNWHYLGSQDYFITPDEAIALNSSCSALNEFFVANDMYVAVINDDTQVVDQTTIQNVTAESLLFDDCSSGTVLPEITGEDKTLLFQIPDTGFKYIVDFYILDDPTDITTYPDDIWLEYIDVTNSNITIPVGTSYDPISAHGITTSEYTTTGDEMTDFDPTEDNKVYINSNVDVTKPGTYYTDVRIDRRKTIEAEPGYADFTQHKVLTVSVIDDSTNPIMIMADAAEVNTTDAPTDEASLQEVMDVVAINTETHERIPSDQIVVENLSGYDFSAPKAGEYEFNFSTSIDTGETIYTNNVAQVLTIVPDILSTKNSKIVGPDNLAYQIDAAPTLNELIEENNFYLVDFTDDAVTDANKLTATNIVNDGGYDSSTPGIYTIELNATSSVTGKIVKKLVQVELYTVSPETDYITISVNNPTIELGGESTASYNPYGAYVNFEVEYTDADGVVQRTTTPQTDPNLTITAEPEIDITTPGEYSLVYTVVENDTLAQAQAISTVTVRQLIVNSDVSLVANGLSVLSDNAPKDENELKIAMGVVAYDPQVPGYLNSSEIIVSTDYAYDQAVGTYEVTFYVTGKSGATDILKTSLIVTDDASTIKNYKWSQNNIIKFQVNSSITLQDAVDKANVVFQLIDSDGNLDSHMLNQTTDVLNVNEEEFVSLSKQEGEVPLIFEYTDPDTSISYQTTVIVDFVDEDPGIVTISVNDTLLLKQGSTYIEPNSYIDLEISYIDENGASIEIEPTPAMFSTIGDEVDTSAENGTKFTVVISVPSPLDLGTVYKKNVTVEITTENQTDLWVTTANTIPDSVPTNEMLLMDTLILPVTPYSRDNMAIIDYDGLDLNHPEIGVYNIVFSYYDADTGITATQIAELTVE